MLLRSARSIRVVSSTPSLKSLALPLRSMRSRSLVPPIRAGIMEHMSENSVKALVLAQLHARYYKMSTMQSEHLLIGLLSIHGEGFPSSDTDVPVYSDLPHLTVNNVRQAIDELFGARRLNKEGNLLDGLDGDTVELQMEFSEELRQVLFLSGRDREARDAYFITPESMFLAMLSMQDECRAITILKHIRTDLYVLRDILRKELRAAIDESITDAKKNARSASLVQSHLATRSSKSSEDEEIAIKLCRDLCQMARDGKVDPVFGRDKELERLVQVLGRRQKSNPILLGDPGVGKTALAEGLAYKIVHSNWELPPYLQEKTIWQLDVAAMMAGTSERGELEKRLTSLLNYLKTKKEEIILMIDEIHMVVGAGDGPSRSASSGGSDSNFTISNLLKPALARGEITCMGATTYNEYRTYFVGDAALERRFQPVFVGEPSSADTLSILEGLRSIYETHHKCIYEDSALRAAVSLSIRYLPERFLPDKAIDLLDEAGSWVRMQQPRTKKASADASPEALDALDALDAPDAAKKEQEQNMIEVMMDMGILAPAPAPVPAPAPSPSQDPVVTEAIVRDVVSIWTGIPIDDLVAPSTSQSSSHPSSQSDTSATLLNVHDADAYERNRLLRLGDTLQKRVVGQTHAVEVVMRALQRSRVGLRDPKRPIASFLFVGPTGVGKTELVKCLADELFGTSASGEVQGDARGSKRTPLIRLDMSEYMESHSVSRMIGAPPGYVGFDEGGKLTEAVRRNPYSVVLFDEIEKAHPDVYNVLLQILEDGRLTDSKRRTISFKNTIVVLTSNLGTSNLRLSGKGKGVFSNPSDITSSTSDAATTTDRKAYERALLQDSIMTDVRKFFRPEVLNRFDDIVLFEPLDQHAIEEIALRMLQQSIDRIAKVGFHVEIAPETFQRICQEGYHPERGARALRDVISRVLEDVVADRILDRPLIDANADTVVRI